MRILITTGLGANFYIRKAWCNAFVSLGHEVVFWDVNNVPAFDIFNTFEPDIFIGQTWSLSRSIAKNILSRPDLKVILSGNNWGEWDKEENKSIIDHATEEEKKNVEQLQGRPIHILCQYHQKYADHTHNHWKNMGCEVLGLPTCADITEFFPVLPNKEFQRDIVWVGGYLPNKAEHLQQYLLSLCYPKTKLKISLFGDGFSGPFAFGRIPDHLAREFYSSSLISPNLFEMNSTKLGYDINSRAYQISACGGFQVSQRIKALQEDVFTEGEIIFVDSPQEFVETIAYYSKNPQLRVRMIKEASEKVCGHHTNFHRVASIFHKLNLIEEYTNALAKADDNYEEFKSEQQEFLKQIEGFFS